jgi:7-cyano-7-deazaguanine synthase
MYDAVCLASGGLDSTVCLFLLREQGLEALPVFVNYGQRNERKEWNALVSSCGANKFSDPVYFEFSSFGKIVRSGLTDASLRVLEDAFTPNRNLLFLTLGSAVAKTKGVQNVVVGLLSEPTTIFPDQTDVFLRTAETAISESLGSQIRIHCPLRDMTKKDVVLYARKHRISNYYSCHSGSDEPCGRCIACLEYN